MKVRTINGTRPMTKAEWCAQFDAAWAGLMRWAEEVKRSRDTP